MCGWPDDCFAQLGVNGSDCRQACEESVDSVGLACLQAIHDGVACLGTCDPEAITNEDVVRCEAAAQAIDSACE